MISCPFGFCIFISVPQAICVDPLLDFFLQFFVVITHPEVIPDILILCGGNVNGAVPAICQAFLRRFYSTSKPLPGGARGSKSQSAELAARKEPAAGSTPAFPSPAFAEKTTYRGVAQR